MSVENVVPVFCRVVYFGNEDNRIIFLDKRNRPFPKFNRDHFCHIASETVNLFACPEAEDVQHFIPRVGDRIEMLASAV